MQAAPRTCCGVGLVWKRQSSFTPCSVQLAVFAASNVQNTPVMTAMLKGLDAASRTRAT